MNNCRCLNRQRPRPLFRTKCVFMTKHTINSHCINPHGMQIESCYDAFAFVFFGCSGELLLELMSRISKQRDFSGLLFSVWEWLLQPASVWRLLEQSSVEFCCKREWARDLWNTTYGSQFYGRFLQNRDKHRRVLSDTICQMFLFFFYSYYYFAVKNTHTTFVYIFVIFALRAIFFCFFFETKFTLRQIALNLLTFHKKNVQRHTSIQAISIAQKNV